MLNEWMNKIFIDQNKHQKTITILLCILIVSIIKLKNLVIQHTVWNNFKASVKWREKGSYLPLTSNRWSNRFSWIKPYKGIQYNLW